MKILSLLITGIFVISLQGQENPSDPYRAAGTAPAGVEQPDTPEQKNISVCYEAFSLPLAVAAKLQRQQLPDSELYKQLIAAVEKETARQELLMILRAKSGQKATTESVSEEIYPTEYDSPRPSCPVGKPSDSSTSADASKAPSAGPTWSPVTPTAFETRNVGTTMEIEPTLAEDGQIVDVRAVPDLVQLVGRGKWGQGLATTEMPNFETQRINTAFTSRINQPFLLGTISQPPVSKADPDSANRVWFAFVTVTLAKP